MTPIEPDPDHAGGGRRHSRPAIRTTVIVVPRASRCPTEGRTTCRVSLPYYVPRWRYSWRRRRRSSRPFGSRCWCRSPDFCHSRAPASATVRFWRSRRRRRRWASSSTSATRPLRRRPRSTPSSARSASRRSPSPRSWRRCSAPRCWPCCPSPRSTRCRWSPSPAPPASPRWVTRTSSASSPATRW